MSLPIARPPWKDGGKTIESLCRKAIFDFQLVDGVETVALALSGGKDSLGLLFLLHAMMGRGLSYKKLIAIHVTGEFSCGAQVHEEFLADICKELAVPLVICTSTQKRENLECYSCSRERRRLIFEAAKGEGATTIAFGHHRDDNIQTLLMNLFHKGEFAGNLPKIHMYDYGVTLIRPLIYVPEKLLREFAQQYGFARIVCQCPVGQNSMRKQTDQILDDLERIYPRVRGNLSHASLQYGSKKALEK